MALHIGGDDYIQKPYSLGVLLAKVQAVLKRCGRQEELSDREKERYRCGRLEIDFGARRLLVEGKAVKLILTVWGEGYRFCGSCRTALSPRGHGE